MRAKLYLCVVLFAVCFVSGCEAFRKENMPVQGEHKAKLNGLELWYKVSGKGPVCFFPTPGWGSSSDIYIASMKPLEEQFTIVYLDTRGTGRSERPKTFKEYTSKHFAGDLDALRCLIGAKRIWIMGHSAGGMIALHYALAYPNRTKGLLILDSLADGQDEFSTKELEVRWQALKEHPPFRPIVDALTDVSWCDQDEAQFMENTRKGMPLYFSTKDAFEKAYAAFKTGWDSTTLSYDALKGTCTSSSLDFSLVDHLGQIKCPTLLVVGANDYICSLKEAQRLHLGLPNSKLLVIEKAGHFPWIEQPEEFFYWVRKSLPTIGYPQKIESN
jgi:proline iminopeptidase